MKKGPKAALEPGMRSALSIAAPTVDLFIWPLVNSGMGSYHEITTLWPLGAIAEAHTFLGFVEDVRRSKEPKGPKR